MKKSENCTMEVSLSAGNRLETLLSDHNLSTKAVVGNIDALVITKLRNAAVRHHPLLKVHDMMNMKEKQTCRYFD